MSKLAVFVVKQTLNLFNKNAALYVVVAEERYSRLVLKNTTMCGIE